MLRNRSRRLQVGDRGDQGAGYEPDAMPYGVLKFEGGVSVQRVPVTESQVGCIHPPPVYW